MAGLGHIKKNVFSRIIYEPTVENVLDCSDALVKVPIQPSDVNQRQTPVTYPQNIVIWKYPIVIKFRFVILSITTKVLFKCCMPQLCIICMFIDLQIFTVSCYQ